MEWVSLRDRLLREIKEDEDSLRFYFPGEKAVQRIEHHGVDNVKAVYPPCPDAQPSNFSQSVVGHGG
jgi:hypothetical protein